jgi:hypothetical protein
MSSTANISLDDCKAQLASNITKLSTYNIMNVADVLSTIDCPGLVGMINQYGNLSCEKSSFLQALITSTSAISGHIMVQNPTNIRTLPLNLFTHLIGEPGLIKIILIIERKFSRKRERKVARPFSECPYAFVFEIVISGALLRLEFQFLNEYQANLENRNSTRNHAHISHFASVISYNKSDSYIE